ncbi:MAG TPA: hypothetical protein VM491_24995 [Burkholderiaceae bacterium]|nr:hypothetical protein [Burkholderiaceae bacterium]
MPGPRRAAAEGSAAAPDHSQFVAAYRDATLRVSIPPQAAAEFLSRRLLLPFFMMPLLGAGVGLALIGWFVTGLLVFLVGFVVPRLIKRNAAKILLFQALYDEGVYRDLLDAGLLQFEPRQDR